MSRTVHTLVIAGFGTNGEAECAQAAKLAGSDGTTIAHFTDIASGRIRLAAYNFLIFPGGFLDGDELGAAQAAAVRWQHAASVRGARLIDQLLGLVNSGGIILGIGNGFQLLAKLGLLPALDNRYLHRQVALAHNASARFETRWCALTVNAESPCVFTKGITQMCLPVRHREGRLVPDSGDILARLEKEQLVALRYADPKTLEPTQEYPFNPSNSPNAIAGLTTPNGRILGLMPHPEAYIHPASHPGWTRGESAPPGWELLANGVRALRCGE